MTSTTPVTDEELRYPVGRLVRPGSLTREERGAAIADMARRPGIVRSAVRGLTPAQMATPYRDGGWTVAQVVHHLADTHANAYIRFKLGLTAEEPRVAAIDETRWAELGDARELDVEPSLTVLDALHARWTRLMGELPDAAFARRIDHPENGFMTLDDIVATYAWHGRHHTAHIVRLRERKGW